jgi:hypothetical protein
VGALPTAERLHVPAAFLDLELPLDANPLLEQAAQTAAEVDPVLAIVTASGEALRAHEPAERSELHRAWDPVTVAAPFEGLLGVWWVRATVTRDAEDTVQWAIEGGEDSDPAADSWGLLGSGAQSATGDGWLVWDLAQTAALFDTPTYGGYLSIAYGVDDLEQSWSIIDYYSAPGDSLPLATWFLYGDSALGFNDVFELGDPPQPWLGTAIAVQLPEGGRAVGQVEVEGSPTRLDGCWTAAGSSTWYAVDPGGPSEGSEAACAVAPIDDLID